MNTKVKRVDNKEQLIIERDLIDIEVFAVGHWYQKFEEEYPDGTIAVIEFTRGGRRQTPVFLTKSTPILKFESLCAGLKSELDFAPTRSRAGSCVEALADLRPDPTDA